MITFKIFWGINAIVSMIVLFFFFAGLADGTVSSFNIGLWLVIICSLATIMLGSIWLRTQNLPGLALALLFVLAIPALLYLIFILILIFGGGRWN